MKFIYFQFYEGRIPKIFISDPEMIRLIFVKDFDHFKSKMDVDSGEELLNDMLDFLPCKNRRDITYFCIKYINVVCPELNEEQEETR